jgi:hypothetical protein
MKRLLFLAGLCLLASAVAPSVAGARVVRAAPFPAAAFQGHLVARPSWNPPNHVSVKAALLQSAAATTIPMWFRNQATGGTTYKYTMVGRNPFVAEQFPNTTVPTYVISLKLVYGSDGFDPNAYEPCDPAGQSSATRVENSPIFKNKAYTWGGTPIAPTGVQLTDAFQRAQFWTLTNPSGVNPNYHVRLGFSPSTQLIPFTLNYPNTSSELTGTGCPQDKLLATDITQFDSWIQSSVFPKIHSLYPQITSSDFVVFLLHNVFFYNGTPSDCCVLDYHNAFGSPVQTYAVAMYNTSGDFSSQVDIAPLSRAVAQWMDDPLGNDLSGGNPTPAWGNVGDVSGCLSYLDLGDPLYGTEFPVQLSGFTYHPQELPFFSWFYHQKPSIAVNNWYSDQGTFSSFAAPCS